MTGQGKRKKLGQHFLVDTAIAHQIAEASGAAPGAEMVEIGPGKGALTGPLLETGASVTALELDQALFDHLSHTLGRNPRLKLVRVNALRFDFDSLPAPFRVASNLPYSVAVTIIKKLISHKARIAAMTLMTQAEVAQRLCAQAGEDGYGSLSVFVGYHCTAELLFTVPPSAFRPRPKVESAVIRLTPRLKPPVEVDDEEAFFGLVQTAFAHRRKTIKNNLAKVWEDKAALAQAFDSAGVEPSTRAEEMTMKQFAALSRFLGAGNIRSPK